jgi:threonylcarbamoyladenosine tRNA methylthiotransferase MtaB
MPHKLRIAIETLGCKLNQAESEALSRSFVNAGCDIVSPNEAADVYILNSCTVTHVADRKGRHSLRMARRLNPTALIVATGCYAVRAAGELKTIADVVIPNEEKARLIEIVGEKLNMNQSLDGRENNLRTRAFIKAQDGCNRRCAYCIVPYVRGREKSMPADDVIAEINARVTGGFREVVLTGTEVGSYSCDGLDIKGLLSRILSGTRIERLRISSLQPSEITTGLLALWRDPRLCPHFHISLQSGSDGVLSRMKRGYSRVDCLEAAGLIREVLPDAAITTDIIAGFPGETDAEFQQTVDFCRSMDFARIHVFPYSPRPGTAAASMPGQVGTPLKKERTRAMQALAKESALAFQSRFLGRTMSVLWEQKSHGGIWSGYTANYIRVYARSSRDLTNHLERVVLTKAYRDGLLGELIPEKEQLWKLL